MKNSYLYLAYLPIASIFFSGDTNAVDFSIGGGYPFVLVPEVSIATNDDSQRWYINGKFGFEKGASIGFEQSFGSKGKHAAGLLLGLIGTDQSDHTDNDYWEKESTNGVALSYSYNFNGLNKAGMRVRIEYGYGKTDKSHTPHTDGSITVSYQF